MPTIRNIAVGLPRKGEHILALEGYDKVRGLNFYRAIGGGIKFGETAEAALRREFREKLDCELDRSSMKGAWCAGSQSRTSAPERGRYFPMEPLTTSCPEAGRKPDDHRMRNSILEEWPIVEVRGFGRVPGWGPRTRVFLRSPSADEHRCGYE